MQQFANAALGFVYRSLVGLRHAVGRKYMGLRGKSNNSFVTSSIAPLGARDPIRQMFRFLKLRAFTGVCRRVSQDSSGCAFVI